MAFNKKIPFLTRGLLCWFICLTGMYAAAQDVVNLGQVQEAADQGNADAQNNLGLMYREGQGVKKSYKEAAKLFQRAADQGNVDAQNNLGLMYREGQGVKRSYQKAAKLFRQAAAQGNADAQNNLGLMYRKEQGVKKSYQKAAKLFRQAAEQGHGAAQLYLGQMHQKAQGVIKDFVQAHMWFNLSAASGIDAATKGRNTVEKKMMPIQTAEAWRLAREFNPRSNDAPPNRGSVESCSGMSKPDKQE